MRQNFILLTVFIILVILMSVFPSSVSAAKKRVTKKSLSASKSQSLGISYSKASLSRPTNSIITVFQNLGSVSSMTYTLNYSANGIAQGVVGSLTPSGLSTETRDLYLGTCSKGVCTAHYNITNASLTIETYTTSNTKHIKRYKIKW